MSDDGVSFDTENWTDGEKDQFIRGVMLAQVWGITLDKEPTEIIETAVWGDDEDLSDEWGKATHGESHELARAICDHYDIPYSKAGDSVKLRRPYGPRYQNAWDKLLGPSPEEKAMGAAVSSLLSQQGDPREQ